MNRVRDNAVSGNPTVGRKTVVAVSIMVLIALVHWFRVGTYLPGSLFTLYYSFFGDVIIPFGMYFLLWMNDVHVPFLRDWRVKAMLVFGAACSTEVLQAFGVPLLGRTFDPLDFVMFGVGVMLAVFVDKLLLDRLFLRWPLKTGNPSDAARQ
jgi:hypothetical protein